MKQKKIEAKPRRLRKERRRCLRLVGPFGIKILTYNHLPLNYKYCTNAEGIDISAFGVAFKYPKVLYTGDRLRVLIHDLKGYHEDFIASMSIVRRRTKDILSRKFAAKFLDVDLKRKEELYLYIGKERKDNANESQTKH